MNRYLCVTFSILSLSVLGLNTVAQAFEDPQTVCSDRTIRGKGVPNDCLPYALTLADALVARAGIRTQAIMVALDNPQTHQHFGNHIFLTYLDQKGQRWVIDNNRPGAIRVFTQSQVKWTEAIMGWQNFGGKHLVHILKVSDLPATSAADKRYFARELAWYGTAGYHKAVNVTSAQLGVVHR
jgi:hypothetical protein